MLVPFTTNARRRRRKSTSRALPLSFQRHTGFLRLPFQVWKSYVRLYSVFGGIPYYNKFVDPSMSVRENIMNLLVESGSRLENEVPLYLSSEISKITNANEVFGALAQGYSRYKDILDQSHVTSGTCMMISRNISCSIASKRCAVSTSFGKIVWERFPRSFQKSGSAGTTIR